MARLRLKLSRPCATALWGITLRPAIDDTVDAVQILEDAAVKKPKGWSIADFSEKAFQLFDGERTTVELLCHEDAMNSVIDHFGEQAKTKPVDDTLFLLTAEVSLSPTFFAWVFQFGGEIILQGPEEAVYTYQEMKVTT